ncbi:phenylalanine--tRNA ligase subunit beta [Nesterenkonia natronophila]|uniref:Phenylalanine--tRNA ligase beta subunit n=1 Tax=Nesterenkonia natronophila TaxID=2174932 RepID=A0A3A4FBK9_9MICC|nr:phenylalanine--tRNA ligase subunit beta [Nesterenkonia natronophila]RJN32184.1 phenylalanine--tRNA ligase subunit beta [Nesterenkonia natronophila]
MRIPLSWIREYTQFPADGTAEDLMADLVRVGLEEEEVHTGELSGPIVVGEVLEKHPEPQSNGKTINWCRVRVVPEGQSQTLTGEGIDPSGVQGVVCGAHNFEVGDKVVVTLPGAVLPGDFRIAARKTYGHVSAGMIASVKELGIGEDHAGILVLSTLGLDPEPGADALDLLGLSDSAAEINVTPDRGYAFSIRGVAREYSHATGTAFTDPAELVTLPARARAGHPVVLKDEAPIYDTPGCDSFVARTVTGVDAAAPTPPWMAARLRLAGLRPISIAVDISNYVMWELGQPLHFYDAEKLTGAIEVRRAAPGETLTTLDDKQRTLNTEDLVIADGSGAIGLAGVMGGASTEVTAQTSTVLIESAHFDPITVSRTRRRHKLPSEAAKRNERGVDPLLPAVAAQRAVDLLIQLAGGAETGEVTQVGNPLTPAPISLDPTLPERIVGVPFGVQQVTETLTDVGCSIEAQETGMLRATPPSWRPDLTIPESLVEEIARLVGYDTIPSRLPVAPAGRGLTEAQQRRRTVFTGLAAAGYTEVLTYPFYSEEANQLFGRADETDVLPMVRLANPIASQFPTLRTTLLPGILDALRRNVSRGFNDVALFEAGSVFLPDEGLGSREIPGLGFYPGDEVVAQLQAGIPHQPHHLAVAVAGREPGEIIGQPGRARDWADAVEAARKVARLLGVEIEIVQGTHQAFHPGRTAHLLLKGEPIGHAGELHPKIVEEQDLPARTSVMELNVGTLIDAAVGQTIAQPLSTFPPTTQDVALVVEQPVTAGELRQTLMEGAGELLEHVQLFDIYSGEGIEEGKKSMAFALRFRAADRTLTAEEASAARTGAVDLASDRHGAQQRG